MSAVSSPAFPSLVNLLRHSRFVLAISVPALALLAQGAGTAEQRIVDSIAALKSAIFRAVPGETIILKDGVYSTSGPLTIKCAGTAEKPITIAAETDGGAELTGSHGFTVSEPAEHILIYGFKFTHAAGKNVVGAGTRHVRFTRNTTSSFAAAARVN